MRADNHRSTHPAPAGKPRSAIVLRALALSFLVGAGAATAGQQDAAGTLHNANEDDNVVDKTGNQVITATDKLKEGLSSLSA